MFLSKQMTLRSYIYVLLFCKETFQDFGDHKRGQTNGGRLRCYVGTKRGDLRGDSARELKEIRSTAIFLLLVT